MKKEFKDSVYCKIYKSLICRSPLPFDNKQENKNKETEPLGFKRFSARFSYILCKKLDGMANIPGTTGWWSMRALKGYGMCEEKFCPDEYSNESDYVNFPITKEILENAYQYRDPAYQRLLSLNDIKKVLNLNKSLVVLSFDIFQGIYDAPKGYVPFPRANEKKLGGHGVTVVGWSDKNQVLSFANSWGEKWGNKGYGYLPYSYLEKYTIECWAIMSRKDWQNFKQDLGENNFKDKKGELIKTQLNKVSPVVYGRSPLWVLDLYKPDGKIGGWSHFSILDYGNIIEIEEIFILPEFRQLGWGTKILEIIENIAKSHGISTIKGWVSVQDIITEERESMVKNYFTKAGFEIIPNRTKFRGSCWKIQKSILKNIYFNTNF